MSNATEVPTPTALVGKVVQGWYPAANYRGISKRYEWRRLLVERVRQLEDDPLCAETLSVDPLLERGQTLLIGTDLDKQAPRTFYLEAWREPRIVPKARTDRRPWQVLFDVCPRGFSPAGVDDPPPATWLDEGEAFAFARAFNQREMEDPQGLWAVAVRPHVGGPPAS